MSTEIKKEIQLEIAHVLFIDIVGYSKLLIDDQRELQQQLNEIVRGTEQFRAAEAAGKLVRLPTGDGMALVFFTSPAAPVQCALEISDALQSHSQLRLRMGINTGPVSGVADVNDKSNIAGAGINMAQRVMDIGDAGHILLSKRAAEDLVQYRQWERDLHNLGEFEVKHGVRISIVNLYTDKLGNPHVPEKLKQFFSKTKIQANTGVIAPGCRPRCGRANLISAEAETKQLDGWDSGKKHRGFAFPKPERRESERLLCRRHPGRDSDALIEDRRPEGHLAHIDAALQKRAGEPARDRQAAWRRPHPGRQRAEER
jgi:hypothetical protein